MKKTLFLFACLFSFYCSGSEKVYPVKGTILEIKPDSMLIVIAHDTIPDLMMPMVMPFDLIDLKEIDGLSIGDSVHFEFTWGDTSTWARRFKIVGKGKLPIDEEDDFFEFDSEEVDDSINNMHYDTKISAKEFMSTQDIDEDILEDIKDALEEMENVIIRYENMEIDNQFIEEVVNMLGKFVIFEFIPEFKHLGLSLEELRGILIDLDIDSLDSAKKELLKNYIISIFEDLEKWYDEVVIKQTAQDIHYLDAALLANITQLDLIIK